MCICGCSLLSLEIIWVENSRSLNSSALEWSKSSWSYLPQVSCEAAKKVPAVSLLWRRSLLLVVHVVKRDSDLSPRPKQFLATLAPKHQLASCITGEQLGQLSNVKKIPRHWLKGKYNVGNVDFGTRWYSFYGLIWKIWTESLGRATYQFVGKVKFMGYQEELWKLNEMNSSVIRLALVYQPVLPHELVRDI